MINVMNNLDLMKVNSSPINFLNVTYLPLADSSTRSDHTDANHSQLISMYTENKDNLLTEQKKNELLQKKALIATKKRNESVAKCLLCMDSFGFKKRKHIMLAMGEHTLLLLPTSFSIADSITQGHCRIVPMKHIPSLTSIECDEDILREITGIYVYVIL